VGVGVDSDVAKGLSLLHAAAEAGHTEAQATLGSYYRDKDDVQSFKFNLAAAENGNVICMLDVASQYKIGEGVERSLQAAHAWTLKSRRGG